MTTSASSHALWHSAHDIDASLTSVNDDANHPLEQALRALDALQVPTVAVIQGPAYGAGCELALTCATTFGERYVAETNHTTFAAEFHVRYLREVKLGEHVATMRACQDPSAVVAAPQVEIVEVICFSLSLPLSLCIA